MTDAEIDQLIMRLLDLHHQAVTERSHYYTGTLLTLAIQAITHLRSETRQLARKKTK